VSERNKEIEKERVRDREKERKRDSSFPSKAFFCARGWYKNSLSPIFRKTSRLKAPISCCVLRYNWQLSYCLVWLSFLMFCVVLNETVWVLKSIALEQERQRWYRRKQKTKILIKQKWVFKKRRQLQESSFELCVDNDEAVFILFLFLIWHPTSRKENQFFQSSVIVKSNKHLFRNLFKALQHTSKTIQYHTLFIEVFYIL
jgi:hypothetical protein